MSLNQAMFDKDSEYTQALDYDGGTQPVYIGEAKPGSAKGATVWRIKKLTYGASGVTDVQWAGGVNTFTKEWDERASYSYS